MSFSISRNLFGRRGFQQLSRRSFSTSKRIFADQVRIIEVGPRDGLQNEKTSIPVETKIELVNRLAPEAIAQQKAAAASIPVAAPVSAPAPAIVTSQPLPAAAQNAQAKQVQQHTAPTPQVVMQTVPMDPLAGPVAHKTAAKPAKLAKAVKHNAAPVHVATADKPVAKPADKPAKKTNGIPALRMTADASRP